MSFYEKQLDSNTVYKGIVVDIKVDKVKLSNGSISSREIVHHPGGVCVVAITEENKILMVRQFRYSMGEELFEIPAGKLEYGEEPFECAKRELSEETGYSAKRWIDLGVFYPSAGVYNEKLYQYLALDLTKGEMHLDENELLSVEEVDIKKLYEMIMSNELKDAKTIIGVIKAKNYLENLENHSTDIVL